MKTILSPMRKAIEDYTMIEEGDKIAVALSGGKDSITLMLALKNLQRFYPKHFELIAITIDPGSNSFDIPYLEKVCNDAGVELAVEKTDIREIVFDVRKEQNPCSLCANMRRGALNNVAKAHGCNKLALGHHLDDVVDTFLMSLFYAGKLHTFSPVTYLSNADITVIRPLIYIEEKTIKKFVKTNNIEPMKKACKVDGETSREFVKNLIITLSKDIPRVKTCIFGAIVRSGIDGWKEIK